MDPYPHLERIVAGRLGLTRNQIRAARAAHLKKGDHWALAKNRAVAFNDAGLQILAELGQLPPPSSMEPAPPRIVAQASAGALQVGAYVKFKVARTYPNGNRRYIDAKVDGLDGPSPTWRVKIHPDACERFTPGMIFEAVFIRHLLAECRRRPRRKGRW